MIDLYLILFSFISRYVSNSLRNRSKSTELGVTEEREKLNVAYFFEIYVERWIDGSKDKETVSSFPRYQERLLCMSPRCFFFDDIELVHGFDHLLPPYSILDLVNVGSRTSSS
jgi:hypothetical protein